MESTSKNLNDYFAILIRRKFYILATWIVITAVAVAVAYNLPKVFRSTATMLMQAPMPEKLSDSTGHLYADEQIQTVYQKVLTTQNILEIIKEQGLFESDKDEVPQDSSMQSDLVEAFKESTEVEIATSSLANNNAKFADIVFNISFSYEKPEKARDVVSALAKLLIEYNDKARKQRAFKVTGFLVEELEKLNKKSQELDSKIAGYKEQHIFSLPDQIQANMAAIERMETESRDTESQIRNTKDRIIYLEAELARANSDFSGATDDDKKPKTKEETLRLLQAKYAQLSSVYSSSHPDLLRIKREIKALSAFADLTPSREDIAERLAVSKNELKVLGESYKENHPEVTKKKTEIENLERQLTHAKSDISANDNRGSMHSSNPAYLALDVQLRNSRSELQSLIQKQEYLKAKLENTKNLLSMTPRVEVEYGDLIRERDSTIKKYNQLKEKWLDAKLVQSIEEEQQGQTLTILEPPNLPVHQEKAIRKKVAIGGCVFGLFAGIALALLMEYFDPAVRGYRSVIEITGLTPIVVIPYIDTLSEQAEHLEDKKQIIQYKVWLIIFNLVLLGAAMLYFLLMELLN